MLDELRDTPEVLYGAGLALLLVLLLAPVVGRIAGRLGIVDRPGGRRAHEREILRLGGLALFGDVVPVLVFVDVSDEVRGSCSARRLPRSWARSTTSSASAGG
jgi:UDP-N-acetylmuramyl pentapeptide phosphotransferase/UDP-N-acetylglucosamine-1-phosphate transferase